MSEMLDKAERARFLAVQRLRRTDQYAADLLDLALLLEHTSNGSISVNCVVTPDGRQSDFELGEIQPDWLESASEEEVAERLATLIQQNIANGQLR